MAYTAYFGTFAKHENSTKQPSYQSWASFDVVFKNGADISRPVISLSADFATISGFNYAVLLGRFYWIRERNMERSGLCVIQLEIDPLASWKTEIGSSSLYILRASAADDPNIKDNMYPVLMNPTLNYQSVASSYPDYTDGYYIINALGTTNNATTLYQMDFDTFRRVISNLFAQAADAQAIGSDYAMAVVNSMFNPIDYINWAAWSPIPFDDSAVNTMYLGKWSYTVQTGDSIGIIEDSIKTISGQLSIPKHPQESRGNYLNFYPFTEYILNLQPFGMIPIDPKRVNNLNVVNYYELIDAQSGIASLQLVDENTGSVIENATCKYLVDIPIGSAAEGKGLVTSLIGGAAALLTGNVAAGIAAGASALGSATDFLNPQARSVGAQGSIAAFKTRQGFLSIFHRIAPEDNARNGRPLCQVRTPASLGGFMIAQKGDIEAAAPLPELLTIKNYLETGFYYE